MTPLAMPAIFDLPAAKTFADMLRAAPGPLVLDGSQVERIGVAGLQLLLSAQAAAAASGHRFEIDRPSAPLNAAAQTAGAIVLLATDR